MPFNTEQLSYASKAAIDFYMKNEPVDQINVARPWIKKLIDGKKDWSGGLQNVVEQIRFSNDSNFQAYFGDGQVSYNRKRTLDQAKFTWGSFHDGFGLNEDELIQNGITMEADNRNAEPTPDEKVNLTNLLKENMDTLKLGFQEGFDKMALRDGTQSTLEIPGLDYLVSTTPSTGTVGGIPASKAYWQNYADLTVGATSNPIVDAMETAWRKCITFGGLVPDYLMAGEDFIDAYRTAGGDKVSAQVVLGDNKGNRAPRTIDAGIGQGIQTGLYFKGVEIIWNPVFDILDTEDSPTVPWNSRLYMLNMATSIKLRPIKGHWMIPRRPPRVYDRYVFYTALTAKAAMTTNKRNANAVLALA